MIITVCGKPGSGKSTLAKYLAKKFHYKFISIGNEARKIASKLRISIIELSKRAEKDKKIDKLIDSINLKYKNKDMHVIDSRIAFYFFPKSLKIFLNIRPEIAAKRILATKRPTERMKTFKETLKEIKERFRIDRRRYKRNYGIDIYNIKNYDIVIDTSAMDIAEMNHFAEKAVRKFIKEQL